MRDDDDDGDGATSQAISSAIWAAIETGDVDDRHLEAITSIAGEALDAVQDLIHNRRTVLGRSKYIKFKKLVIQVIGVDGGSLFDGLESTGAPPLNKKHRGAKAGNVAALHVAAHALLVSAGLSDAPKSMVHAAAATMHALANDPEEYAAALDACHPNRVGSVGLNNAVASVHTALGNVYATHEPDAVHTRTVLGQHAEDVAHVIACAAHGVSHLAWEAFSNGVTPEVSLSDCVRAAHTATTADLTGGNAFAAPNLGHHLLQVGASIACTNAGNLLGRRSLTPAGVRVGGGSFSPLALPSSAARRALAPAPTPVSVAPAPTPAPVQAKGHHLRILVAHMRGKGLLDRGSVGGSSPRPWEEALSKDATVASDAAGNAGKWVAPHVTLAVRAGDGTFPLSDEDIMRISTQGKDEEWAWPNGGTWRGMRALTEHVIGGGSTMVSPDDLAAEFVRTVCPDVANTRVKPLGFDTKEGKFVKRVTNNIPSQTQDYDTRALRTLLGEVLTTNVVVDVECEPRPAGRCVLTGDATDTVTLVLTWTRVRTCDDGSVLLGNKVHRIPIMACLCPTILALYALRMSLVARATKQEAYNPANLPYLKILASTFSEAM